MEAQQGSVSWLGRIMGAGSRNRSAVTAERVAVVGVGVFVLLFAAVWVPYYFFDFATQFLFPVWAPLVLVVWAFALTAIVFGVIGAHGASGLGGDGRGSAWRGIATGVILLVLALPVLWFGGSVSALSGQTNHSPGVLQLDAGESDIGPCNSFEPVAVSSLNSDKTLDCEPQGADLVFPDGTRVTLPTGDLGSGGTNANGTSGDTYTYTGVGIYGIYATQSSPDCSEFQEWGSPGARAKIHEAFGQRYGCE